MKSFVVVFGFRLYTERLILCVPRQVLLQSPHFLQGHFTRKLSLVISEHVRIYIENLDHRILKMLGAHIGLVYGEGGIIGKVM
jgi:hypothetical protein